MRHHRLALVLGFVGSYNCLPAAAQEHWVEYTDARGTRIEYPADMFPTKNRVEVGEAFSTADGRARLHMYSIPNAKALSPGKFMRTHFPGARSALTYDRVARNFFALSTRREGVILYVRCNFSRSRGGTLHCVELRYPQGEKATWDAVVTRISRSLRPLP
jgi:hypothetical protein